MTEDSRTVDVVSFGEVMGAIRSEGRIRMGGPLTLSIAGAETNTAIGLSRLGHKARFTTRLGDDEFALLVLRTLRAEGVDVDKCRITAGMPTGLIFFESPTGNLRRVTYRRRDSAATNLEAADLVELFSGSPRILHLTGITPALGPGPREAVLAAVQAARSQDVKVCLDVNFRSQLWSREEASKTLKALVPQVDVLVASADELDVVAPDQAGETAQTAALLDAGAIEVVVKKGAGGASRFGADGSVHQDAVRVAVTDPVGAGDAFVAGYLSGLLEGVGPRERLLRAVTVSAFAVASQGDWEGLPTRAELDLLGHPSETVVR